MVIYDFLPLLKSLGLSDISAARGADALSSLILILCAWLANFIAKRGILRVVTRIVKRTPVAWDDAFLEAGVFTRLSHIAPALVVTSFGSEFFLRSDRAGRILDVVVQIYVLVIILLVVFALLDAAHEIFQRRSLARNAPLKGFVQGAKLIAVLLSGLAFLSILLSRSPVYFLSGLGALTAVLLLVFRDAILGLVAGVQLSVNRMVQIGDWLELPKFEADGEVLDVGLTTVKIQNWDKTISTVPTYALISDPVKNWRGMSEAGGRRIKRAIYLDMQSFRFVDDQLLEEFKRIRRLRPYLEQKLAEIYAWNETNAVSDEPSPNARRLTNVGCFRAYVESYLREHPKIHKDLTFLVRQLAPTTHGMPLEIYVFTTDTAWAVYEGIQSDIFDHLLTVLSKFQLEVFQSPSGRDMRLLPEALLTLPSRAASN